VAALGLVVVAEYAIRDNEPYSAYNSPELSSIPGDGQGPLERLRVVLVAHAG